MTITYPLQWPATQFRIDYDKRVISKFKPINRNQAFELLGNELRRLGATNSVITSDLRITASGRPYANENPGDTAVAVYFDYNGSRHCMAVDQYVRLWENIRAIEKSIDAIRSIERWGGAKIMESAISGFKALPAEAITVARAWHEVLEVSPNASPEVIKAAYRQQLHKTHPDKGGNASAFAEVQAAYEESQS